MFLDIEQRTETTNFNLHNECTSIKQKTKRCLISCIDDYQNKKGRLQSIFEISLYYTRLLNMKKKTGDPKDHVLRFLFNILDYLAERGISFEGTEGMFLKDFISLFLYFFANEMDLKISISESIIGMFSCIFRSENCCLSDFGKILMIFTLDKVKFTYKYEEFYKSVLEFFNQFENVFSNLIEESSINFLSLLKAHYSIFNKLHWFVSLKSNMFDNEAIEKWVKSSVTLLDFSLKYINRTTSRPTDAQILIILKEFQFPANYIFNKIWDFLKRASADSQNLLLAAFATICYHFIELHKKHKNTPIETELEIAEVNLMKFCRRKSGGEDIENMGEELRNRFEDIKKQCAELDLDFGVSLLLEDSPDSP